MRPDGIPLAASASALLAGNLAASPSVYADRTYVVNQSLLVWTGTTDPSLAGTMGSTCDDWSSNASGALGNLGAPWAASGLWFNDNNLADPCSSPFSVYCFQQ